MPTYRRAFVEGATYFFTVVTYGRLPILTTDESRAILHDAWLDVRGRFPFKTVAVCLLPDHLHCIWSLPEGDAAYPMRWKEIKRLFTKAYLARVGPGEERSASRVKQGEAAIWQRRYWEHMIRDEQDLGRHEDYIHYYRLKHGLVQCVTDWPWSSFHRYIRMGYYEREWGGTVEKVLEGMVVGE
jgi:putative transposase